MHIHIHHHHYYSNDDVTQMLGKIMDQLAALEAAITAEDTVIESAITLINGIPALIAAAGTDPVKLKALADDVTARKQALADAIIANTSAAPATTDPTATPSAAPANPAPMT